MGEIREKGGYTYGIYARPVETWTGAYFLVESELDKARASEAVQKTLEIITAWAEKPFASEEALAETRNYLIARLSPETPSEWVSTLANLLLHGYTPDWYIQQGEHLSQLENFRITRTGRWDSLESRWAACWWEGKWECWCRFMI